HALLLVVGKGIRGGARPRHLSRQQGRTGYSGDGEGKTRGAGCQPARPTAQLHFLASSSSMALTTLSESGFSAGSYRATISPLRPTRNLVKFHWISPPNFGFVSLLVRYLYSSDWPSPLTTTLDSMSNLTLYVFVQKSLISALLPGSCLPNSLAGM